MSAFNEARSIGAPRQITADGSVYCLWAKWRGRGVRKRTRDRLQSAKKVLFIMAAIVTSRANVVVLTETNGPPFRILTAKSRGESGALLSPYKVLNLEEDGRDLPIQEEHISVWYNEEAKNVHVHHTFFFDDIEMRKIDYSTLIDLENEEFAFPVLTLSVPDRVGRVLKATSSKYEKVKIPSYNTASDTLVLCYTVTSVDAVLPDLEHLGIALIELPFSKIKIGLYYTYFMISVGEYAWNRKLTTSSRRVNGGDVSQCAGPFFRRKSEFPNYVIGEISSVYQGLLERMKNYFIANGRTAEEIGSLFASLPTINTIAPVSTLLARGSSARGRYGVSRR